MAIFEISFENKLNSSLSIGDLVHASIVGTAGTVGTPQELGKVTSIQGNIITLDTGSSTLTAQDVETMFLFFSKPTAINESSLKGYYADVAFQNYSKKYAELFAISSEVVPSSK